MSIGEKIKYFRERNNLTQEFIAENLNISQTAYSRIERNITKLTVDRLESIANLLNIHASIFFLELKEINTHTHTHTHTRAS